MSHRDTHAAPVPDAPPGEVATELAAYPSGPAHLPPAHVVPAQTLHGPTAGQTVHTQSGQATVELALAFAVFALLVFGLIDAARAIYTLQGLTRAAEAVAHQTDLVVNATYTGPGSNGITTQSLTTDMGVGLTPPFTFGRTASPIAFGTTAPTTVSRGPGYQELSNSNVYVCGAPSLAIPWVIKVTVKTTFTPVTSYFIGGKQLALSRSATVLTAQGEFSGTPSSVLQTICPAH
jgi:Flp pilus assembly protein TadG